MSVLALPAVVSNISYYVPDVNQLKHFLEFRRFEGSATQREFCKKHLRPVMGHPDEHGNYIHIIGDKPTTAFMAHHDTVHNMEGHQRVIEVGDFIHLPASSRSNCLGADCTTGVWLILHMIKCGVEGVYVVHAGEEIGGQGAQAIVNHPPEWMNRLERAISFDRRGYDSIITHQAAARTASDTFARALGKQLGGEFKPDSTGTFTDSQVYSGDVPECTNISVGYFNQHTKYEKQDVAFAFNLAEALVNVNWSILPTIRDPHIYEGAYKLGGNYTKSGYTVGFGNSNYNGAKDFTGYENSFKKTYTPSELKNKVLDEYLQEENIKSKAEAMVEIVQDNPYLIAKLLVEFGVDKNTLIDELGLWEVNYDW